MLRQKILPAAMLAVLPAAAALAIPLAEATADACRTKPGSSAPPGKHWYYRVNRADKQHCWYLGSAETEQRSHARRAISVVHRPLMRRGVVATESVQPDDDQQTVSAYPGPEETRAEESLPSVDFASRWAKFWTSQDLPAYEVAAIGNVDAVPAKDADQVVQFIGLTNDASSVRPLQAFGEIPFGFVLLAGALAITLPPLAAALLRLARAPPASDPKRLTTPNQLGHYRRLRRAGSNEATDGSLLARTQTGPSAWRSQTPPDPSDDFETGLQELMGALQQASAGPYTLQSFAPAARRRRTAASGTRHRSELAHWLEQGTE
jgi:hypothetical protein